MSVLLPLHHCLELAAEAGALGAGYLVAHRGWLSGSGKPFMQSFYPENFEREMGCTEAEWLMWLPRATRS